jgi:caa(3)-type oxidase subunit IV
MQHASAAAHPLHPSYVLVWAALVLLFVSSVAFSAVSSVIVGVVFAFVIALIKALMVAAWFMHLNIEKRWVWLILLAGFTVVFVMWLGIAPDVMENQGLNWVKQLPPASGH